MIEWLKLILTLITGVATAVWAVHKWINTQNERLKKERERWSALYVNPFLLSCEDLQSRLYNILCYNGLELLNKRYPDKIYAEEILYLIAKYFGWQQCIYRYSPYAHDAQVLKLTEAIGHTFATDTIELGPFCFFRTEQRTLGRMVMERATGQFGEEFDTISLIEFMQKLKESDYLKKKSIEELLEILKKSKNVSELPSSARKRICKVQNHLVELLEYLEEKEEITFFISETHKKRLPAKYVSDSSEDFTNDA